MVKNRRKDSPPAQDQQIQASVVPRTHTVLIVDDEEDLRFIARDVLEQQGYSVLEATDGLAALKAVEQGLKLDLIITDLMMPEMNGAELIERIRQTHPDMKFIIISGSSNRTLIEKGVADTTIPLLIKPFNLDDLVQYVDHIFEHGSHPALAD